MTWSPTVEQRSKASESQRRRWARPGERERMSITMRERLAGRVMPEQERLGRVEAQTRNWADPEYKVRQSAAMSRGQRATSESIALRERKAYLADLKAGPCTDCGQRFPPECIDFDHVPGRGKKLFMLGNGEKTHMMEELRIEVAKCDVVCSNCHRTRTVTRARTRNDS